MTEFLKFDKGNWTEEEDELFLNALNDWPGTIDDKIRQLQDSGKIYRSRHGMKHRASILLKSQKENPKDLSCWKPEEDAYILQALTQPYISLYDLGGKLHKGPLEHRSKDAVHMRVAFLNKTQTVLKIVSRV